MQITNLAKRLELAGLSEKQARVYVAALFLGPAAVQRISEQSDVNRATTYVILAELADMGLVSETTEGKKTLFVAEPPEAIERYLNSLEKDIEVRKTQLKDTMSELKDVSRVEVADAPVVRFFKGPEAVLAVSSYLKRKAPVNSEVYSLSNFDEVLKIFPDIAEKNPKDRKRKNITSKLIYSSTETDLNDDTSTGRKVKKIKEPVKGDINIYNDRMSILSYNGDESVGVIIESKEIVASMRQLFELAWSNDNKK
jgi:sugar-specific transcriptional regulator TrmB